MKNKFPLTIQFGKLLISGMLRAGPCGVSILIDSEQSQNEMAISVWHEIIHLIEMGAGKDAKDCDEEMTEKLAVRLAEAFPEILELARAPR